MNSVQRANSIFRSKPLHVYAIVITFLLLLLYWETVTGVKAAALFKGWLWVVFSFSVITIPISVWLIVQFIISIPETNVSFRRVAEASLLLIGIIILSYANLYHQSYHLFGSGTFSGASLTGGDFLYYSITTFTSTGYGDISPLTLLAKGASATEMMIGYFSGTVFMAILVWKLVHEQKKQ
jgi:voltage-gated potassium channel